MRSQRHLVALTCGTTLEPDGLVLTESGWLLLRFEEDDSIRRFPPHRVDAAKSFEVEVEDD